MKSENKKFKVKRELKYRVPADTIRRIKKACEGYGYGKVLADAAGVRGEYISIILKSKLATSAMIQKVLSGVEKIEQQKQVA